MALDLFCYCSQGPSDAEPLWQEAASALRARFGNGLVVYEIKEADDTHREIALEFGLRAASRFLISVNDKEALAWELTNVSKTLQSLFGEANIVVLLDNESLIK
jgi:hypothetical protein